MSRIKMEQSVNEVHGELTRLLLQYWEIMGRPGLPEFMSLLPIEPALEHIERTRIKECGNGNGDISIH
jgi:hypothetical protein